MDAIRRLCGFAAGLERLLVARDAAELEGTWSDLTLGQVGGEALALARRADTESRPRAPGAHRVARAGARGGRSPAARGAGALPRISRSAHRDVPRAGAGALA